MKMKQRNDFDKVLLSTWPVIQPLEEGKGAPAGPVSHRVMLVLAGVLGHLDDGKMMICLMNLPSIEIKLQIRNYYNPTVTEIVTLISCSQEPVKLNKNMDFLNFHYFLMIFIFSIIPGLQCSVNFLLYSKVT